MRLPITDLEGGTILKVEPGPRHGHRQSSPDTLLVLKQGVLFHVEVWCDPEGNGPGYLYVERVTASPFPSLDALASAFGNSILGIKPKKPPTSRS